MEEEAVKYIELFELQQYIGECIGELEQWVKAEIESCSRSGGHYYLNLLQKLPDGEIIARARGMIWRFRSSIISDFEQESGQEFKAGITVVLKAKVEYHPVYGLSLSISAIDPVFTIGQRELEKQRTIASLTESGHFQMQKELELPYLPSSVAVISSETAAGYGDFMKHLQSGSRGYKFNCTLIPALMQGDNAPSSIINALYEACEEPGRFNLIVIMRGGGADADMFCFDDYSLCRAIAECPVPVFTAIGHERDHHVADMAAHSSFKTPTALADALIEWVDEVEDSMLDAMLAVRDALKDKIYRQSSEIARSVSTIVFALKSRVDAMDKDLALLQARIDAADPRKLLRQGYTLAVDTQGRLLKGASSLDVGDDFYLRFADGSWNCSIKKLL